MCGLGLVEDPYESGLASSPGDRSRRENPLGKGAAYLDSSQKPHYVFYIFRRRENRLKSFWNLALHTVEI